MAVLAGFIQASLAQGDAVFVAIPEGNAQLLRQELDGGGTVQVWLPPIWGWATLVWMRKREYL